VTGGKSKIVKVVSQEDLDSAQDELSEKLKTQIINDLSQAIGSEQKINENLILWKITSQEKSVDLDKETENFDLRIALEGKALVYDAKKLTDIIIAQVTPELPPDSRVVESDSNQLNFEVAKIDEAGEWADLKIHIEYQIASAIDLEQLKTKIAGQDRSSARRILMQVPGVRDVRFDYKYSLTNSIPKNINRIKMFLKS
jgi:hypothetical protein